MDYWKGKVAVVTGASSGNGAQIAIDLAKAGLQVVGLARRKDRLDALAAENPGIHAIQCDVTQVDSVVAAFREINAKFGKVHILVNNAGRGKKGKILDADVAHQEYLDTINVNFSATVICTREAFRLIEKHEDLAYIININSSVGHTTPNYMLTSNNNIYAASKHATTNFTEALRLDLAHAGNKRVRVSVSFDKIFVFN